MLQMGKVARKIREQKQDQKFAQERPGQDKWHRNPHYRSNCRKAATKARIEAARAQLLNAVREVQITQNTGPVMVAATNLLRVEEGKTLPQRPHQRPAYAMTTDEFHDLQMRHLEWRRKHLDGQYELFREERDKWEAKKKKEEDDLNKRRKELREEELRWERKMLDSGKGNKTSTPKKGLEVTLRKCMTREVIEKPYGGGYGGEEEQQQGCSRRVLGDTDTDGDEESVLPEDSTQSSQSSLSSPSNSMSVSLDVSRDLLG